MENASKALIIAGAILISILIISLGILIYNQARSVMSDNAMSQADISAFNAQFTQYVGTNVSGSTVNSMAQAVLANNLSQDDETRCVSVELDDEEIVSKTGNDVKTYAATSATYTVDVIYGTDGLVDSITATNNRSSSD